MASDEELKDEELVDFEGSDYEVDGVYDELELLEENGKEEDLKERTSNLQKSDPHYRSDVDKGPLESSRSSAFGNVEILNGRLSVGLEILETATSTESESARASISRVAEAMGATCRSATAVLPEVEVSEACQRSSFGTRRFSSALPGSTSTVSGLKGALETPEHQRLNAVLCQHTTRKSWDMFSPSSNKQCAESGDTEEEKEEKGEICVPVLPAPSHVDGESAHHTSESIDSRMMKHNNSDLEDGELDESAVVMPSPQNPIFFPFIYFCARKHSILLVATYLAHSVASSVASLRSQF